MMWIIFAVIAVVVLWIIFAYNRLVTLRSRANEAWADIDVQLKRRYDLIPNLVNTVKGYATHESTAFEKVTAARAQALSAGSSGTPGARAAAEGELSGALKSIFAIAEAYPDLKANQNFLELQRELEDTENKIQAARRFYNGNVRDLNIAIETFPTNIFAGMFHFQKRDFFEIPEGEHSREPVNVSF